MRVWLCNFRYNSRNIRYTSIIHYMSSFVSVFKGVYSPQKYKVIRRILWNSIITLYLSLWNRDWIFPIYRRYTTTTTMCMISTEKPLNCVQYTSDDNNKKDKSIPSPRFQSASTSNIDFHLRYWLHTYILSSPLPGDRSYTTTTIHDDMRISHVSLISSQRIDIH